VTLLGGEKITNEIESHKVPVSEVSEITSEDVQTDSGYAYRRRLVEVGDFADPKERAKFNVVLDLWDRFLLEHDEEYPIPSRKNGYKTNPAAEWFYNHEKGYEGTMREWGDELVPNAEALYPMQRHNDMERVFPSGVVTERARKILELSDDAVAIRARAAIMKEIAVEAATFSVDDQIKLVSLGAGAAVPAIAAVQEIKDVLGKPTKMDLYDINDETLKFAKESTQRAGIPGDEVTTHTGSYELSYQLPDNSVTILEALGLFEYLPTSRCKELITNAHRIVKPGGVAVFSNMLAGRRQLAMNQRGVKWPGVKPRTEAEFIDIAISAGIPSGELTYTESEDGIYAVIEVRKS
jgi:ubiquinone/menaquinone biosynthesis C-methylase UbiE